MCSKHLAKFLWELKRTHTPRHLAKSSKKPSLPSPKAFLHRGCDPEQNFGFWWMARHSPKHHIIIFFLVMSSLPWPKVLLIGVSQVPPLHLVSVSAKSQHRWPVKLEHQMVLQGSENYDSPRCLPFNKPASVQTSSDLQKFAECQGGSGKYLGLTQSPGLWCWLRLWLHLPSQNLIWVICGWTCDSSPAWWSDADKGFSNPIEENRSQLDPLPTASFENEGHFFFFKWKTLSRFMVKQIAL